MSDIQVVSIGINILLIVVFILAPLALRIWWKYFGED